MSKRRLIVLAAAVLIGLSIAACAKKTAARRESEWRGLTESEARAKLEGKLPGKIPADKRDAIADKVVGKMRERGVLSDDPAVPDDISGLTDPAGHAPTG